MKYIIIFVLLVSIKDSYGQSIDWKNTQEWKLYKLRGHDLFSYRIDTLKKIEYYSLNRDSIIKYLEESSALPKDSIPIWMGEYVASCSIDNKILKFEVSFYGGFFYCESDRQVYQISNALRKEWQDYISACYRSLYP